MLSNETLAVPVVDESSAMGWAEFRNNLNALDLVCDGDSRATFRSRVKDSGFGALQIRNVGSHGAALMGERSPTRISTYREDLIWVCLVLAGNMRIAQQKQTAELSAGDMVVVDAVQPYRIDVPAASTDTLWVGAPRAMAAGHIWDVDEILGRRIDGTSGSGLIASRVLRHAFSDITTIEEVSANRIAHGLMDVLAAAADGSRLQNAGSRYRNAIIRRIKNYIDSHIEDDTLTVARVASDQGMSTRYLAKIFEGEEQTVSAWIWGRRIARAHAALTGGDGAQSISEIAYAHGFKNVSHFSRMFRDRYGVSPSMLFRSAGLKN